MDIRKEFEFVFSDKSVKDFFQDLKNKNSIFQRFENLETLVRIINDRTAQNFEVKDACLLKLIERIQAAENKSAGLNLITYLFAPGLQRILYEIISKREIFQETWLGLWWQFMQSILNYPISLRPSRVSANLLYETRHRIRDEQRIEYFWQNNIESMGDRDWEAVEDAPSSCFRLASALIEGSDEAGLNEVDKDLVISSRIYGESMKSLAGRLGLDYHNALKRRYRAEKHLRDYWRQKNN